MSSGYLFFTTRIYVYKKTVGPEENCTYKSLMRVMRSLIGPRNRRSERGCMSMKGGNRRDDGRIVRFISVVVFVVVVLSI